MSVCTSTPTLTQFETAISTSFSVTESNSLTTIPAQLATNTATSCLDVETSLNATFCASSTEIVSISTIHDAQTNTVQVPFTIDVFFTQTIPTNTLFTTVCSSLPPSVPPSVPPTSQSSQGASSSVLTLTTPPPLTSLVLSSSTLDDGQVTIIYQTVVSTPPPTSVYVPTTGLVQETHSSTSNAPAHLGVILGASLGGAFGLFLVMALFWWLRRRRHRFDEMFEKPTDDDLRDEATQRSKRFDLDDSDPQPKPYHYGLIGAPTPPGFVDETEVLQQPIPAVGYSTATKVGSESIAASSRRPSTSTGSMAPFLTSESRSHTRPNTESEERYISGKASPPPQVALAFENSRWDGEVPGSPVSFKPSGMGTLKVVNDDD